MQLIRRRRGQVLVELALVMPILLLILFGIVEFGRIFHAYLVIANAARVGARKGAITNNDTEIINAVETAAGHSLDLDSLSITISPSSGGRSKGDSLTVEVDYEVDIFAPVIAQLLPDPFPINGTMVMRIE
ncbi:TadE/TadG family type IV pilus assembly protein [Sporohalobacter salinus]|uniref:TadE/TadG family type IV pilus assembly protein n=1 Tax=Sporohalobacter salinus TaxID=1494606 RepID=UPI00196143D8|nr:TadE family protein [Sporohalobacter salinus]MBM7623014.1 Flp pilus assembly protein TadG [Sporohalobacter salinus]